MRAQHMYVPPKFMHGMQEVVRKQNKPRAIGAAVVWSEPRRRGNWTLAGHDGETRHGTTHCVFTLLDFLARLAALVPRPPVTSRISRGRRHSAFPCMSADLALTLATAQALQGEARNPIAPPASVISARSARLHESVGALQPGQVHSLAAVQRWCPTFRRDALRAPVRQPPAPSRRAAAGAARARVQFERAWRHPRVRPAPRSARAGQCRGARTRPARGRSHVYARRPP